MYILFVTLHIHWSGNSVVYSSSLGNFFAVCDADIVLSSDFFSIIHLFDSVENNEMDLWGINDWILFLWSDIEGSFRSKAVIYYCYGSSVLDATVANGVLDIAVFDAILFIWGIGRIIRTYVNHITSFYLRENSFST